MWGGVPRKRMQRYGFFSNHQNYCKLFSRKSDIFSFIGVTRKSSPYCYIYRAINLTQKERNRLTDKVKNHSFLCIAPFLVFICTKRMHIYYVKTRENRTKFTNSYFELLHANYGVCYELFVTHWELKNYVCDVKKGVSFFLIFPEYRLQLNGSYTATE